MQQAGKAIGVRSAAVPPLVYTEENRRHGTCECGQRIKTGGFGWVHAANLWVTLGNCRNARPRVAARGRQ